MSKTRPEWSQEITKRADDLVALRRDFHRHPELSFTRVRACSRGRRTPAIWERPISLPSS